MEKLTFGYALTGSFCTFERAFRQIEYLQSQGIEVHPIMSFNAKNIDTRFGKSVDFYRSLFEITGNKVIDSLAAAEPVGPKKMFDLLIVSPCTGNTLSKLANGIYDTPVTLSVKSHLRNSRNVLLGVSTNDALSNAGKNIGNLLNMKNTYFVPFRQDSFKNKPCSCVADFTLLPKTIENALNGIQLQPILDIPIE